jgi:dolichol-phosphate mannosyltransferase
VDNLTIVVPTYQEAGNLPRLVQGIRAALGPLDLRTRVLVVDDNSPDGTGKVAEELTRDNDEGFAVEVLHRPRKEGLGRAYIDGLQRVLAARDTTWIGTMDADLSHDPAYLPALVAAAADADLVVGSRYVPGGGTPDWPWPRRLLSVGGNRYTRLFLGSQIADWTGGYVLYHRDLLARCDVGSIRSEGYGFLIELKFRALRACRSIRQVPIVFVDRTRGVSKIPRSTLAENLILVPRLRTGATRGRGH